MASGKLKIVLMRLNVSYDVLKTIYIKIDPAGIKEGHS
jgi:hypothetical protein